MSVHWLRVSKAKPCAVCGKGDWCTYTADGVVCCMRTQTDRPAANGGWLHGCQGRVAAPVAPRTPTGYEDPGFDAYLWWRAARRVLVAEKLQPWADTLGLPIDSLEFMGAATICGMLSFPMHDGNGNVCGIRTRLPSGEKRAVTGSRAGVFLPTVHLTDRVPVVCEGPTDAAAAMALGLEPIGRPSCTGSERHVVDACRRFGYRRVTICADADGPGTAGARKLAEVLNAARIAVRLVTAGGHKDLRDWFRAGATPEQVNSAWSQAEWRE